MGYEGWETGCNGIFRRVLVDLWTGLRGTYYRISVWPPVLLRHIEYFKTEIA